MALCEHYGEDAASRCGAALSWRHPISALYAVALLYGHRISKTVRSQPSLSHAGRDYADERQIAPGEHYGEDAAAAGSAAGERRPTGKVAGIIRRNWRTRGYAGSLQPPGEGRALRRGSTNMLFCPVERRFPFIRIQTRQARRPPDLKQTQPAAFPYPALSPYNHT